jgi:processive 1,2-diacylglycerol beta-glucosyltransferase
MADKLIVGSYLGTLKKTPKVYGELYKLSESMENITDITKTVNKMLSNKLCRFINDFNPSVIVCTHAFPVHMVSSLKYKKNINIPIIAVVTDFANHMFWKNDNVDAYIVAHDYVKQCMIETGIPKDKIYSYGIPISSDFLNKKDRKTILQELGLEDKLTMLLMGGLLGIGKVQDIFKQLLSCNRDLQIIAVTGDNQKLRESLKELADNSKKKVKIFGYTNRVSDLMDASDFLITKPGGLTISEALAKNIPIIMLPPIPGQEERNAKFLLNSGVAASLYPGDSIEGLLTQILDTSLRFHHMKEMSAHLSRPNSSQDILNLMEKL